MVDADTDPTARTLGSVKRSGGAPENASEAPTISIVLPNYNHAHELETSLAAIEAQQSPADEIIIVDDGSTDHSLDVIERFANRLSSIRIVRHEKRQGVCAAVNRGLAEACGSHVVLASADERILPDMCSVLGKTISAFPTADLAISIYTDWFPETDRTRTYGRESDLGMWYVNSDDPAFITAEQLQVLLSRRFVWLGANTAIFRRESLIGVGGLDPQLQWHADWFATYAIALTRGFVAVPRALAWFRVDEQSYSSRGMRDPSQARAVARAVLDKLDEPAFAPVRAGVMAAPAAFSPLLRPILLALTTMPARYRTLGRLAWWWLGEVVRGRRPGAWAKGIRRLKGKRSRQ